MAGLLHIWQSRRYELSWRAKSESDKPPAIIIRIPRSVAQKVPKISKDADAVTNLTNRLDFEADSFNGDTTGSFGFENVLNFFDNDDGWIELAGQLPASQTERCGMCEGSGEMYGGENCRYCKGAGKRPRVNTKETRPLVASISLLLQRLNFAKINLPTSQLQLMCVEVMLTSRERGRVFCGLSGAYSDGVVGWLSNQPALNSVTEAMQLAYATLFKLEKLDQYEFDAKVRDSNGWLIMNCPGDACGYTPTKEVGNNDQLHMNLGVIISITRSNS